MSESEDFPTPNSVFTNCTRASKTLITEYGIVLSFRGQLLNKHLSAFCMSDKVRPMEYVNKSMKNTSYYIM